MVGPFVQYTEPNVYTRTLADQTVISLTGGLRIPLYIGVGSETLRLTDYEIVRGSSSIADNFKSNEDVSTQLTGTNREFTVSKFPIVSGEGQGEVAFDPKFVAVTINGEPAGVAQLFGDEGRVVLSSIPRENDVLKISYNFKRSDTLMEDDDLSIQANDINKDFKVNYPPIVDGSNGGIATTDPEKVTVTVNGTEVTVSSVDGQNGVVTLESAPADGDEVLFSYYTNTWQDTFDYLPVENITEVLRVGTSPGRSDFTNTLDFVIDGNKIQWGNSFSVAAGEVAPASELFDTTQINSFLYDNKVFMRPTTGTVDSSNKDFVLEYIPTMGTGRGTPTDDVSKVVAYVGVSVAAALASGAVEVESLDGLTRTIELKEAPTSGELVFVTYWHNQISDDIFTFTSVTPSTISTDGEYKIDSANNGAVLNIVKDVASCSVSDPDFATEGITFPAGGYDAQTVPGFGVEETILLNFINATDYLVLSSIGPDGSNGSGSLGQTYIDGKTGTRFSVMPGTAVTYVPGDLLEFDIIRNFTTSVLPQFAVPGIKTTITETQGVAAANTALMSTYNKSGLEPNVGDFYYITGDHSKTEYPIKVYTKIKNVVADIGEVNTGNRLSLAAYLSFSNGAVAVALAQVLRNNSGVDANAQDYEEVLSVMESPIKDYGIKPSILCPVTTDQTVINSMRLHCEKMSTIRYRTERTGVYGYGVGTTPEQAQQFAKKMKSERLIGIYPDGAIIGLVDELGNVNESIVDGSLLASAFTGLAVNPIYDVATPLTFKTVTGFSRLVRQMDTVTKNQTAVAGITILEDLVPNLLIRHAMTTNPQNVLTREPTVIFIKDYVQQQIREVLKPFIGRKLLPSLIQDIETAVDNLMNNLVNLEIVTAFNGTSADQDENDPTILSVESFYSPVFPLNWIVATLNLRVKL